MEMEVIKEEADALQEGWSESIIQESHWLFNHIQEEKKAMEVARENAQRMQEAQAKARAQALATADTALGLASSCAVRGDDEGEAAALRRCVALREAWLGPMHGDL